MKSLHKKLIATIVILVLFAVGLSMYNASKNTSEQKQEKVQKVQVIKNKEKQGKRPTQTRLRNGVKQVETASEALELAQTYLQKIETKLEAATSEEMREDPLLCEVVRQNYRLMGVLHTNDSHRWESKSGKRTQHPF